MRVAIDLRWIRSEKIDGISRYTINLVSHLLDSDPEVDYFLIGDEAILEKHAPFSSFPNTKIVPISQPLLSVSDFLLVHRAIEALGVDILHVPNYLTSPFGKGYKKIFTVYDLTPFLFPEALSKSRILWRWFYKTIYPAQMILRTADTIMTSSENTKRDIVQLLRIPPERIQVVWGGVESRFHPNYTVSEQFCQKYGLPQRFLLYVGRQEPYKGLDYLVQAYALLPEPLQQQYKVVIAGKTDSRYIGEIHRRLAESSLQQNFYFLDYVPDEELPLLYSAATLLVHPSLYEGFGLTPLEAMACGIPVIYANTSSLSELLGNAAVAVDPASAVSLANGIYELLQNEQLRLSLSKNGIEHIQRYSWENVALNVLNIYEQLAKNSVGE